MSTLSEKPHVHDRNAVRHSANHWLAVYDQGKAKMSGACGLQFQVWSQLYWWLLVLRNASLNMSFFFYICRCQCLSLHGCLFSKQFFPLMKNVFLVHAFQITDKCTSSWFAQIHRRIQNGTGWKFWWLRPHWIKGHHIPVAVQENVNENQFAL